MIVKQVHSQLAQTQHTNLLLLKHLLGDILSTAHKASKVAKLNNKTILSANVSITQYKNSHDLAKPEMSKILSRPFYAIY